MQPILASIANMHRPAGSDLVADAGLSQAPTRPRVLILADRPIVWQAWRARGLVAVAQTAVGTNLSLKEAPDAFVIDLDVIQPAELDTVWRLHDLLDVPVVMLTSDIDDYHTAGYLRRGVDEVLNSCCSDALLAATVAAILRRYERRQTRAEPTILRLGDVQIDLATRIVHRSGCTEKLSRTEHRLLLALVRARGRACTAADLLSRVWGVESASATQYLRLYIRYLRQKIEDDPRHPRYILNVWGTGYQLVTDTGPVGVDLPHEGNEALAAHKNPSRT